MCDSCKPPKAVTIPIVEILAEDLGLPVRVIELHNRLKEADAEVMADILADDGQPV